MCRLCGCRDETINFIISEYSRLEQRDYKTKYDWLEDLINGKLVGRVFASRSGDWGLIPDRVIPKI